MPAAAAASGGAARARAAGSATASISVAERLTGLGPSQQCRVARCAQKSRIESSSIQDVRTSVIGRDSLSLTCLRGPPLSTANDTINRAAAHPASHDARRQRRPLQVRASLTPHSPCSGAQQATPAVPAAHPAGAGGTLASRRDGQHPVLLSFRCPPTRYLYTVTTNSKERKGDTL
jgi:hypothetical protein